MGYPKTMGNLPYFSVGNCLSFGFITIFLLQASTNLAVEQISQPQVLKHSAPAEILGAP